ncbi:MAG: hypothetical protein ACXVI7_11600 [Halobacteriota archaeon]
MHTIQQHVLPRAEIEQLLHSVLSAYFRTKPLEELVDIKDRSKRLEQLAYIALAGAECSSCITESQEFKQSGLQISPLDIRNEAVQRLFSSIMSHVAEQCPPAHSFHGDNVILRSECRELLCQAMCRHDAEMIARFITHHELHDVVV